MTKQEKLNYQVKQIVEDYRAIYEFLIDYLASKVSYCAIMGVFPYLCMLVCEGYEVLEKNNFIPTNFIDEKQLDKIKQCRAKGIKLYEKFKQSTYNSIQEFNNNEFEKFLNKTNPLFPRWMKEPFVDNYFIVVLNNKIVGNYHLYANKILNQEIGTYNGNIPEEIKELSTTLAWFVVTIVRHLDGELLNYEAQPFTFPHKEYDLNMKKNYKNFSIMNQPPILMAFLDIISVLNYYNEFFSKASRDFYLKLKIKYAILFYSIIGTKNILEYCQKENITLQDGLLEEIYLLDKNLCSNLLRRYSLHYEYKENWSINPIDEAFESKFHRSIEEIDSLLDESILDLAKKLNDFLIVYPF